MARICVLKGMKSWIAGLIIGLFYPFSASSQHLLPPNQPEQDACHALPLCGGQFTTPYSYQGTGRVIDLDQTPCSGGEVNSMWMSVTIVNAGKLAFRIIPIDTVDDYDFAVLNASNTSCSSLISSNVVRCNFNNNLPGSNPGGIVGLKDSAGQDFVQGGTQGMSWVNSIDVTPGQVYLIMINNFGNDNFSGPSAGFTIDFSASTATFKDLPPPVFDSTVRQCSDSSVIIQFSKAIQCTSIATDGSQFSISPSISIAGAAGVNCVGDSGYTNQVVINFAGHYPSGTYTVTGQQGSSGKTISDICGDAMTVTPGQAPTISFIIPPQIKDDYLPPDTTKCNYSTISESALRAFDQYLWSTGETTSSIIVNNAGTYTLQVKDANGCTGTESVTVKDSTCPQYVHFPSAFTPNGDGRNDVFRAVYAGPTSSFRFAVYDRWGRMVFATNDPARAWDGTTGGTPQPAGVYVWVCTYKLYQQPEAFQRGTVMLIR